MSSFHRMERVDAFGGCFFFFFFFEVAGIWQRFLSIEVEYLWFDRVCMCLEATELKICDPSIITEIMDAWSYKYFMFFYSQLKETTWNELSSYTAWNVMLFRLLIFYGTRSTDYRSKVKNTCHTPSTYYKLQWTNTNRACGSFIDPVYSWMTVYLSA